VERQRESGQDGRPAADELLAESIALQAGERHLETEDMDEGGDGCDAGGQGGHRGQRPADCRDQRSGRTDLPQTAADLYMACAAAVEETGANLLNSEARQDKNDGVAELMEEIAGQAEKMPEQLEETPAMAPQQAIACHK